MDFQIPKIIAHRGAPRIAPENTLASLRAAKQAGASFTEFDVMLSLDKVAMVYHDETLERTTQTKGKLAEKTYAELSELDAGSWFDPKFKAEKIPTLEEYILEARKLGLGINIELKAAPGSEETLAEIVLANLNQYWPSSLPTPLLSSFSVANLEALKKYDCHYPLGLNVDRWQNQVILTAKKLECASIHIHHEQATNEIITKHQNHNFKTLAYTVNNKARANKLIKMGVDAIFSDIPDLLNPIE